MNIFSSLSKYTKEGAHEEYLLRRGITEEEFLREREQKRQKEHQEELKRLGITEEEYLKRKKKSEFKAAFKKCMADVGTFLFVLGFLALMFALPFAKEAEPILLVFGIIAMAVIFILLCMPVYFLIRESIDNSSISYKTVIAVILTVIVMGIIIYILSDFSTDVVPIELTKLHPD